MSSLLIHRGGALENAKNKLDCRGPGLIHVDTCKHKRSIAWIVGEFRGCHQHVFVFVVLCHQSLFILTCLQCEKKERDRQKREIREKRQLWKASWGIVWVWVKHRPTRVLPRNPFCPLIHPLRGWIHPLLIALQLIVTMPLNQGFSYDKSILFRWLGYNRQVVGAQYGSTSRSVSIKQYGRRVNQTDVPQRLHYVNKYNIWDLHVRCWYRWSTQYFRNKIFSGCFIFWIKHKRLLFGGFFHNRTHIFSVVITHNCEVEIPMDGQLIKTEPRRSQKFAASVKLFRLDMNKQIDEWEAKMFELDKNIFMKICVCVFVFVYLYYCICICLFILMYFELSAWNINLSLSHEASEWWGCGHTICVPHHTQLSHRTL